jgi:hypothetical protein
MQSAFTCADTSLVRLDCSNLANSKTMTYLESACAIYITKKRALQELVDHGTPESEFQAFFEDLGDCEEYYANAVLHWLGY